ncbi:zinc finger CCCH domain-containing protein 67-like isoform X1 [Durio zibethinus]|uniref:Zinc finger CCCH domain-containing protein 67-like isoform X1 n=1 Tax=Durio zibethinus TaxID=66656 RepID=A0A6P5YKA5_DURZI|nr:zinc finger CCCH domain-containing protein 67-like isoform X1 [Durio zibethinus]
MGSCEEYSSSLPETPSQTQPESPSRFNLDTLLSDLYPGTEKEEESLVEGLKSVSLEENDRNSYGDNNNGSENLQAEWEDGENYQYPLRPCAEDCSFFLKTGTCKFGLNCKFNHPVGRGFQDEENYKGWTAEQTGRIECKYYRATGGCKYGNACRYRHCNEDYVLAPLEANSFGLPVQVVIKENREKDGFKEQTGQIECKYYLTSGGCKYGTACKYSHFKEKSRYLEKSELPLPELNFLGLPIRMLEKECPYYMRTGSCGYGASCRFNHPDPTSAEGSNTFSSDPSGFGGHSSENYNGESDALPSSPKPTAASSSLNMMSDKHVPYLNHNSSSAHVTHLNSEWNGHEEKTSHPYSSRSIHSAMKTEDISKLHQEPIQVDEFPERPGEPECPYFMKTGYCKFKTACKFHHPKIRSSKPTAFILSSAGLPLRPDRKICWNYEKFGVCKYGRSCYFHHPENLFSSDFWVDSIP